MVTSADLRGGLSADQLILDKHVAPGIGKSEVAGAIYVDNVGIFGEDFDKVTATAEKVKKSLEDHGLACKGIDAPTDDHHFGLAIFSKTGRIQVAGCRIWKIRLALLYAAGCRRMTGHTLRRLVGALHMGRSCQKRVALSTAQHLPLHRARRGQGDPLMAVCPHGAGARCQLDVLRVV